MEKLGGMGDGTVMRQCSDPGRVKAPQADPSKSPEEACGPDRAGANSWRQRGKRVRGLPALCWLGERPAWSSPRGSGPRPGNERVPEMGATLSGEGAGVWGQWLRAMSTPTCPGPI